MKLCDARRAQLFGLQWYVLRVEARKETAAGLLLQRIGYTVFLPTVWQRRRRLAKHHRRITEVTRPLAARYLLIGFDQDPPWPVVLDFAWIIAAVGINGKPSQVTDNVMKRLFAIHTSESLVAETVLERPAERGSLHRGKVAEVLRGALAGQLVTIENLKGQRAEVAPHAADQPVQISVSFDNLQMID